MIKYIDEFIESKKVGLSLKSCELYKRALLYFHEFLKTNNLLLSTLTKKEIGDYLIFAEKKGLKKSTINQHITALRSFYYFLHEKEGMNDPTEGLAYTKIEKQGKRLQEGDIERIINFLENDSSMPIRDRLLMLFMLNYGFTGQYLCQMAESTIKKLGDKFFILISENNKREIESINMREMIREYLREREEIKSKQKELFLTKSGKPLNKPHIIHIAKRLSKLLDLDDSSLLLIKSARETTDKTNFIDNRYEIVKKLKRSDNYRIIKVIDRNDGDTLKLIKYFEIFEKNIDYIATEYRCMRECNHKSIINLLDYKEIESDGKRVVYITMEYSGDELLQNYAGNININNFTDVTTNLLSGLSYLHKKGFLHGNIRPSNIIVQRKETHLIPKFLDIGFSSNNNSLTATTRVKKSPFIPFELFNSSVIDARQDVYSLGVALYYLLTGTFPYEIIDNRYVRRKEKVNIDEPIRNVITKFIDKMIAQNPEDRFATVESAHLEIKEILKDSLRNEKIETTSITVSMEDEIRLIEIAIKSLKKERSFSQFVIIEGDKDSGKSYLLNEIKSIASMNSVTNFTIDIAKNPSVKTLAEIFISEKIEKQLGAVELDYKSKRISFFEQTFISMNKKTPFILAIDNFDQCSEEFFDFFAYISKKVVDGKERILFVLTSTDPTQSSKIAELIGRLSVEEEKKIIIKLPILTRERLKELLIEKFEYEVADDIVDYIHKESNGRIGKIVNSVNFLIRDGYLATHPDSNIVNLTYSFYESKKYDIGDELDALEKLLMNSVACFGKPIEKGFLFEIIKGISIIKSEDFNSSLVKLVDNGMLLEFCELKKTLLCFPDEFKANLYYNRISTEQRVYLHNIIGLLLENRAEYASEVEKNEILHHFYSAGNSLKSLYYLKRDGERSKSLGLIRDSLLCYDKLDRFFDNYDRKERIGILFEKTRLYLDIYELENATNELNKSVNLIEDVKERLIFTTLSARISINAGRIKEGVDSLSEATLIAQKMPISEINYLIHIMKADGLIMLSQYSEAINFLSILLKLPIGEEYRACELSLKNMLGLSYFYLGNFKDAENIFREVMLLSKNSEKWGEKKAYVTALNNIGTLHYEQCNFDTALKYREEAISYSIDNYDILSRAILLLNKAAIKHRVGKLKEAMDLYNEVLKIYSPLGEVRNYENAIFGLGLIYANIGVWDEAQRYQQRAMQLAKERSNNLILGYSHGLRGDIERSRGDYELAIKSYQIAQDIFKKYNLSKELCEVYLYETESHIALLHIDEAYQSLDNAKKISGIERFPDSSLRITLQDISWQLAREPIHYSEINSMFNRIKEDPIIVSDWELYLRYLKVFSIYKKMIGANDRAEEAISNLKNRMRDIISGFRGEILENFFKLSEFGRFLKDFEESGEKSDIERFLEINLEIAESLDIDSVLEKILNNILILSKADSVYLLLKNEYGKFNVRAAIDKDGKSLGSFMPQVLKIILKRLIDNKETIIFSDAENEPLLAKLNNISKNSVKSLMAIPLIIRREVIGILYVEDHGQRDLFKIRDMKLYSLFGSQAAIAIENAKNHALIISKNIELKNEAKNIKLELDKKDSFLDITERRLKYDYNEIIGKSEKIIAILSLLDRICDSEITTFIEGESGTGKELIARAIYRNGKRREKPFITENCAAFSESILEGELFGHKKGAFTEAISDRSGIFEIADGGTVFLDEVGEMSFEMQKKLLRFLQTGEFRRVGDDVVRRVDVRIISATNRNLKEMVKNGKFREDLYYRLNVISISLPPLRERREDIPLLVKYFIKRYNEAKNENIEITDEILTALKNYHWPGNIRELENEISRLIVLREGAVIKIKMIKEDPRFNVDFIPEFAPNY